MTNQNKTPLLLLCVLLVFSSIPVIAQEQAPEITWYDYESVDLRALNKVTAQTTNFKAKIGQTVKFGEIFIKVQACRKPPAIEKQESASFLQIWEKDKALDKSKWIFNKDLIFYEITANRFLHHMVRMLVGTMIEVAKDSMPLEMFYKMIQGKDIKSRVITCPAHGLYLNKVNY